MAKVRVHNPEQRRRALRAVMGRHDLTVNAWAVKAGVSEGTIRNFLNGGKHGSESMSDRVYSLLANSIGETVAELQGEAPSPATRLDVDLSPPRMLPVINRVQAGKWNEVVDSGAFKTERAIPAVHRVGPRAFVLEVDGPSMEPDFHAKDLIVVDPDVEAHPGNFVIAWLEEEGAATFKKYRETRTGTHRVVELVPTNRDWPTLTLSKKKDGRILGVVTDHIRRLI